MSPRPHNPPGDFHPPQHVWADFGDGPVIAHVHKGAHDVGGETKYGIQAPDGSVHTIGHREPADRDERGSGGTFWAV